MKQVLKKALKAGGVDMPRSKYARIFGKDDRLRRNVFLACKTPVLAEAVMAEVVSDHRVIEVLMRAGMVAAKIILDVERKLGRKLQRSRVETLVKLFLAISARNTAEEVGGTHRSMEATRKMLSAIVQKIDMSISSKCDECGFDTGSACQSMPCLSN